MAGLARICKTQDTFRTTKAERKRLRDEILGFLGEDHSFYDGCLWSTSILFPSARVTMICAKDSLRGTSEVPCTLVAWLGPNHPPMILKHFGYPHRLIVIFFFRKHSATGVTRDHLRFPGLDELCAFWVKASTLGRSATEEAGGKVGSFGPSAFAMMVCKFSIEFNKYFSIPLSISIRKFVLWARFQTSLRGRHLVSFRPLKCKCPKCSRSANTKCWGAEFSSGRMSVLFGDGLEKFAEKHRSLPQVCRSFCWKRERAQGHGASPVAWAERRLVSLSLPACYCKYRIV